MPIKLSDKCLSWASILDGKTAAQAMRTASMPFVSPHLALMPDAHLGKGATVGSVIPTDGAIMPAAVGVDIGCGMLAVRTQFVREQITPDVAHQVRLGLENAIQLGHGAPDGRHTPDEGRVAYLENESVLAMDPDKVYGGWRGQLGSLGGGNHFIELVHDEADRIWMFLHSGSRGVGNKIATHWIKVAQNLNARWHISFPDGDRDLAYLVDTDMWSYWRAMDWAQKYAWENRLEMMDRFTRVLSEVMDESVHSEREVHCHHNFTRREKHFGREMFVTRKGAIDAHEKVMGLIPGSMGAASYVVQGLGHPASLCSAPHGAGRVFSRRRAKEELSWEEQVRIMTDRGVEWSGSRSFLDEHPLAYKDIDQVMADASDLVEIVHTFTQLVNVKGE